MNAQAGILLLGALAQVAAPRAAEDGVQPQGQVAGGGRVDRQLAPYFTQGPLRAAVERFRAGDWPAAITGLEAGLRAPGVEAEEKLRARLLLGLALGSAGRHADCSGVMEKLAEDDKLLAAHASYQAARCHLRAGANEQALAASGRVPADTVPAAESALVALEALTRLGRWAEVLARADQFLERFPQGPRRPEALAAAATAAEKLGKSKDALGRWRLLWATSDNETFSQRAAERLTAAKTATTRVAADWVGRGMVLFNRHDNNQAEATFDQALRASELTPLLACQARFHLAQSVWKNRQRARAAPLFTEAETACRAAGDADLTVRSMYQRARCLDYMKEHALAREVFGRIEKDHPTHSYADDARLRAAEVATEDEALDEAEALLAELPERHPTGDMVGEALWRRALRALDERRFPAARALLEENIRRVPRADIWYAQGRAEYWLGRSHQQEGDAAAAARSYELCIRRYPLSVYAWQAFQRLEEMAPAHHRRLLSELRPGALRPEPASGPLSLAAFEREPAWQRGLALARMGLASEAHRELARLRSSAEAPGVGNEDVPWATALVLHRAGLWNTSHALVATRLAHFRLSHPSPTGPGHWQVAYPRAYGQLVDRASATHGYPAPLQMAIMREESAFDARAVSTAGCLGLTMLKPSTADAHAGRKVSREQLFDAQTNVDLGGRELAKMLARYGGSVAAAIASYNAGPGAVDRWRKEMAHMPLDALLEHIPYDETRGYTKRVLASYFAYAWLYDNRRPVPAAVIR